MFNGNHAYNAFLVQIVHLVVDSGELGQPDVAFGLKSKVVRRRKFFDPVVYFCKSMRDSTSPP